MPQYRKLHTKITESFDVNEMPDDFHRLLWTWLPLALCKEGRGFYHGEWIKGKLMPFRNDVTGHLIMIALDYFADAGLIVPYEVDGRRYFYVPTWHEYQNTSRDGDSPYPAPPNENSDDLPAHEQLASNSGAGHAKSRLREELEGEREESQSTPATPDPFDQTQEFIEQLTGLPATNKSSSDAIREIITMQATQEDIQAGYAWLCEQKKPMLYFGQLVGPTRTAMGIRLQRRNGGARASPDEPAGYAAIRKYLAREEAADGDEN